MKANVCLFQPQFVVSVACILVGQNMKHDTCWKPHYPFGRTYFFSVMFKKEAFLVTYLMFKN